MNRLFRLSRPPGPERLFAPPWLLSFLLLLALGFPEASARAQVPTTLPEIETALSEVQQRIQDGEDRLRDFVRAYVALDSIEAERENRIPSWFTDDLQLGDSHLRYTAAQILTLPHPYDRSSVFPRSLDQPLQFAGGRRVVRTEGELQDLFQSLSRSVPGVLAEIRRLDEERLALEGRRRLHLPSAEPLTQGPGTGAGGWTRRGDALLAEGKRLLDLGDFQGAQAKFGEVLSLEPDLAGAYLGRAIASYFLSQPESAITDIENAVLLDPDNGRSFYWRGRFREELIQRSDLAAADYQAGCMKLDRAACEALRAMAVERDRQGEIAYEAKDISTALQRFTEATEIDVRYPAAWFNRGLMESHWQDWASAIRSFSNFILHQENAHAYARGAPIPLPEPDEKGIAEANFRIGFAYRMQGNHRQALPYLHLAITQGAVADPANTPTYMYETAEAYEAVGDMERARLIYKQLCEMNDRNACDKIGGGSP